MDIDKKKYNEILGWIINIYPSFDEATKKDAEYYFPELKEESEDEKIKQELIEYHKAQAFLDGKPNNKHVKYVAWLEKQGEQKFEQKFFINDKVVHKATGKIWTIHHYLKDTNSYYVEDNDGLLHHYRESELKLVEQKPAEWNEEDERIKNNCISFLGFNKEYSPQAECIDECINWLKSLRPQNRCTYNPYKEVVESITEMCKHYDNMDVGSLQDFYDNVKVKCKDAKEYDSLFPQNTRKPSDEHYELEEFAKIVRGNLTGISKAVQKLFEAKYLQLTGNKMYGGFKD